jgi:hypothetical protein
VSSATKVLRDPSKLFIRYKIIPKHIMDLQACLGPGRTATLFDGELEKLTFVLINTIGYFEVYVMTSEWTDVITHGVKFYFLSSGRLTIKVGNITTDSLCWNVGEIWELEVEQCGTHTGSIC